jgi:dimethylaniline monooxygenase (N-oxide forming)
MWLPSKVSQFVQTKLIQLLHAKQPEELKCDHRLLEQNAAIRGDFIEKVNTGIIKIHRATVDTLTHTGLSLSSGVRVDADVIICCTGYDMTDMPYLPRDAVMSPEKPPPHMDLYKRFVSPYYENLFVIGRIENVGALAPAAEAQARVAAAMVTGRVQRPTRETMLASIWQARERGAKKFVQSDRHLITVHCVEYVDDVLTPLKAAPTARRLLWRAREGKPVKALKVFGAVYFGVPSSGQWRLVGEGKKERLAESTVLRIAAGGKELSEGEREALDKDALVK